MLRHRSMPAAVLALLGLTAGCSGQAEDVVTAVFTAPEEGTTQTLTALSMGPVATWDPQAMSSMSDIAFAKRTFLRTLTAYAVDETGVAPHVVGDLATEPGTADEDLTTWTFELRQDVRWEDGELLTCADVKHGIARNFSPDLSGGPRHPIAFLDIPKKPDGMSIYAGPFQDGSDDEAGVKAFDAAVSCDQSTLTIRLAQPVSDFNDMVTQPSFAAVRADHDRQGESPYAIFSAGPYTLSAQWQSPTGGTFVRNPYWSADSDPIRSARPDRIEYVEGLEPQTVVQRVMDDRDDGRRSVSLDSAPPALQQQITAAQNVRNRSVNPRTGLVDYLAPSFDSPVFESDQARAALALSTNRDAYVTALGGATTAVPADSVIPATLSGAEADIEPPSAPTSEDLATAADLLADSGLSTPVPITVAYRSSPTMDSAMAALLPGWREAGFEPTLQPVRDNYFPTIADPDSAAGIDLFWANWSPEWGSASTVIAPLFDSRINVGTTTSGRDYGRFVDEDVDEAITAAATVADPDQREQAWRDIDRTLRDRGVYVALAERRALYVAGSQVTGLTALDPVGGHVDFAPIGVAP